MDETGQEDETGKDEQDEQRSTPMGRESVENAAKGAAMGAATGAAAGAVAAVVADKAAGGDDPESQEPLEEDEEE